jgi:hypothetical protein
VQFSGRRVNLARPAGSLNGVCRWNAAAVQEFDYIEP